LIGIVSVLLGAFDSKADPLGTTDCFIIPASFCRRMARAAKTWKIVDVSRYKTINDSPAKPQHSFLPGRETGRVDALL
jgi:hypothetical protein